MGSIANKTTLWRLLEQMGIQIPIIQRDYAQGRKGKEALREQFIKDMKTALDNFGANGKKESMKLDFIYGSKDNMGMFIPIDGQQRLTTLWLLHWYIAYRAEKLNDANTRAYLSRFSYLTRDSSKAFCEKLVKESENLPKYEENQNIADIIMNQTWMYNHWKQDPTIQSMLRMLSGVRDNEKIDGIEESFGHEDTAKFESYWEKLTAPSTDECPIVFYLLLLENTEHSDELYVKMNGRGKPLTDFEYFKADLIKYIEGNKQEHPDDPLWCKFYDPRDGYANKLDNQWMDYFWKYRNPHMSIDDMFFTFINRFFLVRLMQSVKDLENSKIDSDDETTRKKRIVYDYLYSYVGDVKVEGSDVTHIPYSKHGFKIYSYLFELLPSDDGGLSIFNVLYNMMENIVKWGNAIIEDNIKNPYAQNNQVFKFAYAMDVTSKDSPNKSIYQLQQTQQIAFWAVCHFFSSERFPLATKEALARWMRIVWNICSIPSEVRSKQNVITAISELARYVKDPADAYNEFRRIDLPKNKNVDKLFAFERHLREEKEKVLHMLWNNGVYYGSIQPFFGKTWEDVICEIEKLPFIKGNIHCLFDTYDGKDIGITWDEFDKRYNHLMSHYNKGFGVDSLKSTLLVSDRRIRDKWYAPQNGNNSAIERNWRSFLLEYSKDVVEWLNEYGPVSHYNPKGTYHRDLLINTDILDKISHKDGIHLAYNSSTAIPVLMYHQATLPYILFNKKRNEILGLLINDGTVRGNKNQVVILDSGQIVLNGATISFKYDINGIPYDFEWTASGDIRLKVGDTTKTFPSTSATCPYSFLNILRSMIV